MGTIIPWKRKVLGSHSGPTFPEHQQVQRPEVDLLSAAKRDEIIDVHANKLLLPLGLAKIAPRTWIDGSTPPARRMFQLSLTKGAGIKACWGFSLDFVPHISGWNRPLASARKISWHRTDKSARLDVIVTPHVLKTYCFLYGAAWLNSELEQHLPTAVEHARETWRRGGTWSGMLDVVQELRDQPINGLGFDNYTQLRLAFAFLNAKVGNIEVAEAELEAYARRSQLVDEVAAQLIKLAHEVSESAKGGA